jgi:hypothetical protein
MKAWEKRTELKGEVLVEVKKLAESIQSWWPDLYYKKEKPKATIVQSVKKLFKKK